MLKLKELNVNIGIIVDDNSCFADNNSILYEKSNVAQFFSSNCILHRASINN
jgi:hypothetical protein